jgi:hypothetical protein
MRYFCSRPVLPPLYWKIDILEIYLLCVPTTDRGTRFQSALEALEMPSQNARQEWLLIKSRRSLRRSHFEPCSSLATA